MNRTNNIKINLKDVYHKDINKNNKVNTKQ